MADTLLDSALARKLNAFQPLAASELKALADIQSAPLAVKRGRQLTHEGQTGHKAFVLQAGWACSYKLLSNGARQIISFPVPGDCVGLRSVLLRTADHSFSALTDAVVSSVDGDRMLKCITEFPRLGAALFWAASRDEAMVVEHLVSMCLRLGVQDPVYRIRRVRLRHHHVNDLEPRSPQKGGHYRLSACGVTKGGYLNSRD